MGGRGYNMAAMLAVAMLGISAAVPVGPAQVPPDTGKRRRSGAQPIVRLDDPATRSKQKSGSLQRMLRKRPARV